MRLTTWGIKQMLGFLNSTVTKTAYFKLALEEDPEDYQVLRQRAPSQDESLSSQHAGQACILDWWHQTEECRPV